MSNSVPNRRAISRELTRVANASVLDVLSFERRSEGKCRRIGITGPPGAGKSSLIGKLVRRRLDDVGNIAVVAVDPTSPVSGGAILGDRIRMEDLATEPRVYIRSLASRLSRDGLADNLPDILETFERAGFGELVLETVGVGQVEYEVRHLVDTTILVLMPGAGDQIQAMKSGILEIADIFVVNKADQPGARQLAADLGAVAEGHARAEGWRPPVVLTTFDEPEGFGRLSEAIDEHQAWAAVSGGRSARLKERRAHHVQNLLVRRIGELVESLPADALNLPFGSLYKAIAGELCGAGSPAQPRGGRD